MLRFVKTCRKLGMSFFAYLGDRLGLSVTARRIPDYQLPLPYQINNVNNISLYTRN